MPSPFDIPTPEQWTKNSPPERPLTRAQKDAEIARLMKKRGGGINATAQTPSKEWKEGPSVAAERKRLVQEGIQNNWADAEADKIRREMARDRELKEIKARRGQRNPLSQAGKAYSEQDAVRHRADLQEKLDVDSAFDAMQGPFPFEQEKKKFRDEFVEDQKRWEKMTDEERFHQGVRDRMGALDRNLSRLKRDYADQPEKYEAAKKHRDLIRERLVKEGKNDWETARGIDKGHEWLMDAHKQTLETSPDSKESLQGIRDSYLATAVENQFKDRMARRHGWMPVSSTYKDLEAAAAKGSEVQYDDAFTPRYRDGMGARYPFLHGNDRDVELGMKFRSTGGEKLSLREPAPVSEGFQTVRQKVKRLGENGEGGPVSVAQEADKPFIHRSGKDAYPRNVEVPDLASVLGTSEAANETQPVKAKEAPRRAETVTLDQFVNNQVEAKRAVPEAMPRLPTQAERNLMRQAEALQGQASEFGRQADNMQANLQAVQEELKKAEEEFEQKHGIGLMEHAIGTKPSSFLGNLGTMAKFWGKHFAKVASGARHESPLVIIEEYKRMTQRAIDMGSQVAGLREQGNRILEQARALRAEAKQLVEGIAQTPESDSAQEDWRTRSHWDHRGRNPVRRFGVEDPSDEKPAFQGPGGVEKAARGFEAAAYSPQEAWALANELSADERRRAEAFRGEKAAKALRQAEGQAAWDEAMDDMANESADRTSAAPAGTSGRAMDRILAGTHRPETGLPEAPVLGTVGAMDWLLGDTSSPAASTGEQSPTHGETYVANPSTHVVWEGGSEPANDASIWERSDKLKPSSPDDLVPFTAEETLREPSLREVLPKDGKIETVAEGASNLSQTERGWAKRRLGSGWADVESRYGNNPERLRNALSSIEAFNKLEQPGSFGDMFWQLGRVSRSDAKNYIAAEMRAKLRKQDYPNLEEQIRGVCDIYDAIRDGRTQPQGDERLFAPAYTNDAGRERWQREKADIEYGGYSQAA